MPSKSVLAENCVCLRKQLCRCYIDRLKILILYGQKISQKKSSKVQINGEMDHFLTLPPSPFPPYPPPPTHSSSPHLSKSSIDPLTELRFHSWPVSGVPQQRLQRHGVRLALTDARPTPDSLHRVVGQHSRGHRLADRPVPGQRDVVCHRDSNVRVEVVVHAVGRGERGEGGLRWTGLSLE